MSRKLYFNYGPMGSAKTLKLLTMAYNFEENHIPFIVLKPSIDNRDGVDVVKSRVGLERECIPIEQDVDLFEIIKEYSKVLACQFSKLEWVLVDECQFLAEKQVDQLAKVVDDLGIDVACFGLRTDFQSKLFPASKRLFEIADTLEEVKTRCSCGRKVIVNARFDKENNLILNGDQVLVGGNDLYKPLCRKCWNRLVENQ